MGTCSQGNKENVNKVGNSNLSKLVKYFYNIPMQQHPDIDSLIINKIESQKIIPRGLSKTLVEEIILFMNQCQGRNQEQEDLLDQFNYVYTQSFKRFSGYGTNLGKFILITSIEVLLCFKSLEMEDLTDVDVWWVQEHFEWRYRQLNTQYKVEYETFLAKNYLIKFLYLLKECARIEQKKMNAELLLFLGSSSTRTDTQEVPNTARTVESFRPQKRMETF